MVINNSRQTSVRKRKESQREQRRLYRKEVEIYSKISSFLEIIVVCNYVWRANYVYFLLSHCQYSGTLSIYCSSFNCRTKIEKRGCISWVANKVAWRSPNFERLVEVIRRRSEQQATRSPSEDSVSHSFLLYSSEFFFKNRFRSINLKWKVLDRRVVGFIVNRLCDVFVLFSVRYEKWNIYSDAFQGFFGTKKQNMSSWRRHSREIGIPTDPYFPHSI